LKKEGKTKFIGVSTYDVLLLEKCMKIEKVQSLQSPYSMLKRDYEESTLPYCLKNNIGVVAYSPMQADLLTGKFYFSKLANDDWRRKSFSFQEQFLSKALALVEKLRHIPKKSGRTVVKLKGKLISALPTR